jgi:hypothetical protein
LVGDCYSQGAGVDDSEISSYVADLLTDFTENERIYSLRDEIGRPLRDLDAMLVAADPVNGTALSFDAERSARKQIGDYALFFAGMYPESIGVNARPISFERLVETGRDSYSIVAAFNLFEYAREAPLFERLATQFETCIYGLSLVRKELDRRRALTPGKGKRQQYLM